MSGTSQAVFVSYASQDAGAAGRICDALRAAGIEIWFDRSELRGGDAWDQKIRRQISSCALFVPIISANMAERPEGSFRLEWDRADQRSHMIARNRPFIVPVALDRAPESGADVPESFQRVQWMRLPGSEPSAAFVAHIARLLTQGAASSAPALLLPDRPAQAGPGRPVAALGAGRPRARTLVAAVAVAMVLALGFVVVDRLVLPKRTTVAPVAATEKSIAVLPFVDMSEKHDQEYFGDGIAGEILNLLVQIPDPKVTGRTSSFQFKGKTGDLQRIGALLNAAYVVEGSVRRAGVRIRVTAQLLDTRDGTHRWSQTDERSASDILRVQDEIAASLVRALQLEVSGSSRSQSRERALNGEAYDSDLRGLHSRDRFEQRGFEEAVTDFRHTLALDPSAVGRAGANAGPSDAVSRRISDCSG